MARNLRIQGVIPPLEPKLPQLLLALLLSLLVAAPALMGCAAGSASPPAPDQPAVVQPAADMDEARAAVEALWAGADGKAGHRLEGRSYAATFVHAGGAGCAVCHVPGADGTDGPGPRSWTPATSTCDECHESISAISEIRTTHGADYDGDGDSGEPLADELGGLLADLMVSIQASARSTGSPLCYHPQRYPHWMNDTDGDGHCSEDEARASNAYEIWTEPMLRASCNYQVVSRERGAWAHNFDYAAQLLIDSIEVLGGTVSRYARPG